MSFIDSPTLNSPFRAPDRHFALDDDGAPTGEIKGFRGRDAQAKADTMKTLLLLAVNNHGGLGRWAFLEFRDIYDASKAIRNRLAQSAPRRVA